jgi:L-rhamnose isomerase
MAFRISDGLIAEDNAKLRADLQEDFEHLARVLGRRDVDIERLVERARGFRVAVPSWGVGTGGTRFARFAGAGEPRDVYEKLDDCETIHRLVRVTPGLSLHSHMLDQSHNVTDPLESLMQSALEVVRAYVQAHLVDRAALAQAQEGNDALLALETLKQTFRTDVSPILAMARELSGGAIDPIASYRAAVIASTRQKSDRRRQAACRASSSRAMKNARTQSAERGMGQHSVFHRPSELNQDFETLLLGRGKPRKSLDVPVKGVMKSANSAATRTWLAASKRFSSPC